MALLIIIYIALPVIILGIILYIIRVYNQLVELHNQLSNAFSQIDIQLKRRHDLIPSLVENIKQYMRYEQDTLNQVIKARNEASEALNFVNNSLDLSSVKKFELAENVLSQTIRGLNIKMEAYPELRTNENVAQLSQELISTENKISFARQFYNDSVTLFNTFKQSFPQILIANHFKRFQSDAPLLEIEDKEQIKQNIKTDFYS